MAPRTHVWLLTPGVPSAPEGARAWLQALLCDPDAVASGWPSWLQEGWAWLLARRSAPALADRCAQAGPALAALELQARDLGRILGPRYEVRPVLRYGGPGAEQAVRAVPRGDRVLLLPLLAQAGGVTTISPLRQAGAVLDRHQVPWVRVQGYPDDPRYLDALAETLREGILGLPGPGPGDAASPGYAVLFVARGLPGPPGPYPRQVQATVEGLVARGRLRGPHDLAFTRRPGFTAGPLPQLAERLGALRQRGARDLVLVPVGFSAEQHETLVELDRELAAQARALGFRAVSRAPTLSCRPSFLRCLAELVDQAEREAGWRAPGPPADLAAPGG